MQKAMRKTLTAGEESLLEETKRKNLDALDEDALVELHRRVRRARSKYVKAYRREAPGAKKGRGAVKAEVFEDALSRVCTRLGVVAKQSAAELRAERLATAAKGPGSTGPESVPDAGDDSDPVQGAPAWRGDRSLVSPVSRKRVAATQARGARRQAKRESR